MFRTIRVIAAAGALCALTATMLWAYQVPDVIILERDRGNEPLSTWVGAVTFPHGFHAVRQACRDCHHKESDKTLGEYVACRQCHNDDDPTDRTGFYRAWHSDGPPSCLGCHTLMRARGNENPVGCTSACHKLT